MKINRSVWNKPVASLAAVALFLTIAPVFAAPPTAPVITTPAQSTTTNPIILSGIAENNVSVVVTGGVGTSTASTTSGGVWNVPVNLKPNVLNNLIVFALNNSGEMSSTTATVGITHNTATSTGTTTPPAATTTPPTATSSPTITLNGDQTDSFFICNGFNDPGAVAFSSAGVSLSVSSSTSSSLDTPGTYTITYTATDGGMTATTTRTVIVNACSSGGGGGNNNDDDDDDNQSNNNNATVIAGTIIGNTALNAGVVLGASTFQFVSNLTIGSRGAEVIELQNRLTATGYFKGPVTGYFGFITKAAVQAFQKANGLPSTGFVGPMTRALLNS